MFPPTAGPAFAPPHAVPVPLPPLHHEEPTQTPVCFIPRTRTLHRFTSCVAFRLALIEQNRIARDVLRWLADAADLPHERAKIIVIPGINWSVAPDVRLGYCRYHHRGGRPAGTAYMMHVGTEGVAEAAGAANARMLWVKGLAAGLAAEVLLHESAHALHAVNAAPLMTFADFTAQLTARLLGVAPTTPVDDHWPRPVPALREIGAVTARRLAACAAPTVPHEIRGDGRLSYPPTAAARPARPMAGVRS